MPLVIRHTAVVDGRAAEVGNAHGLWLIADPDCDLAWRAIAGNETGPFLVELRPVFIDDPPDDWGVRSQTFLIYENGQHLRATGPSVRVTPEVVATAEHAGCLDPGHQRRLKTWLGMRYDRPAVPQKYVTLSRALATKLSVRKDRPVSARYRDVLAQFWDDGGTTKYSLVAVIPGGMFDDTSDEVTAARRWLADAARAVPAELGVAASLESYGDGDVTLEYLEGSYSIDLSRLSWPQNRPGPEGAV
jgi:hypothetical protein